MPTHKLRDRNQRPKYPARKRNLQALSRRLGRSSGSLRSRGLVISVKERLELKAKEQARRTEEGRAHAPDRHEQSRAHVSLPQTEPARSAAYLAGRRDGARDKKFYCLRSTLAYLNGQEYKEGYDDGYDNGE